MQLGDLIDALSNVSPKALVTVDGSQFESIDSYRGYYDHLAIETSQQGTALTVEAVLRELNRAVGATFHGYKGGDYVMNRYTPVWISAYGDASGVAVDGVEVNADGSVTITGGQSDGWL